MKARDGALNRYIHALLSDGKVAGVGTTCKNIARDKLYKLSDLMEIALLLI